MGLVSGEDLSSGPAFFGVALGPRAPKITVHQVDSYDVSPASDPNSSANRFKKAVAAADVNSTALENAARGCRSSRTSLVVPSSLADHTASLDYLSAASTVSRNEDSVSRSPSYSSSRDGSSTTDQPLVFSAALSLASSEITQSSRQSRESIPPMPGSGEEEEEEEDNPFRFKPQALAEMIDSKNIDAFAALGGLTELAKGLQTDLAGGLGLDETWSPPDGIGSLQLGECERFQVRKAVYGTNRIPDKPIRGILELMLLALSDKVLILLSVVAIISLALGLYQSLGRPHAPDELRVEWVDGVTITAAVLIVVVTGAVNDYQKERQFARLNKKKEERMVKAIRSGKSVEISVFDVLVGDVLHLEPGDLVPADGILISGHAVQCDESSLTGESDQIKKSSGAEALDKLQSAFDRNYIDPFIISGSKVLEGIGTYLVTGVGVNSKYGRISMSLSERTEATPLQQKLSIVADNIAIAGVAVATVMFTVLIVQFLIRLPDSKNTTVELVQIFLQIFMVSIAVVVIAVPEGLPLAVTLALAIAVTRMLKDNNLVRVLAACEAMGNVTTVCSDKTGTLTMNKMKVTAGALGVDSHFSDQHSNEFANHSPQDSDARSLDQTPRSSSSDQAVASTKQFCALLSPDVRDIMVKSITLNSTAFEGKEDGAPAFIGSKTEAALLMFAREHLGMRPLQEERANSTVVAVFPFDSSRKYMAVVTRLCDNMYRMYVKGAPEILLEKCSRVILQPMSGLDAAEITKERYNEQLGTISEYASRSLRTLGFAYKDVPSWPILGVSMDSVSVDAILVNMTLLGVLGIQDPLRSGVSEAVGKCQRAGVTVRMVTGDNVQTAESIARECGILTDSGIVIEGPMFRKLPIEEVNDILPHLQVLARSSPEDKRMLVERLKDLGETVAVTGDGTNDGPALRAADVGLSMGISGTEVAREASSIVLMDDNFGSIVKAIEWGRTVNDAIKKFLHFQLTVSITAVTLTFVSAVASDREQSILTPVQLLWVNLIMDTFAALALATDPPNESVHDKKPSAKTDPLISITGWKMIIGQALYQFVVITSLDFAGDRILGLTLPEDTKRLGTIIFNAYVWMQFFNLYNNRRLDNKLNVFEDIHKNPFFIAINVAIIAGQVLIVNFGGNALSATKLSATEWAVTLVLGALSMPVAVVLRLIPDESIQCLFNAPHHLMWNTTVDSDQGPRADLQWFQALENIRSELVAIRQSRSSRLQRLCRDNYDLVKNKVFTESADGDEGVNERSPLLQRPYSDHDRSRSSSVCGPSLVVAGLVAGGVAGWPPTPTPTTPIG